MFILEIIFCRIKEKTKNIHFNKFSHFQKVLFENILMLIVIQLLCVTLAITGQIFLSTQILRNTNATVDEAEAEAE